MNDRIPTDTTAAVRDMPLGFVAASMGAGGTSQAIAEQERAGQAEMVSSTVLPTQGSDTQELRDLGFTFGDVNERDPLFRSATLPEGWSRKGSDHAMHSYVVDERGIPRVNIFYKAAFYDRRADMHVMNVGRKAAQEWVYGDDETPALHAELTAAELDDLEEFARGYVRDAERRPDIYGDRLPRARTLLEAVNAHPNADATSEDPA